MYSTVLVPGTEKGIDGHEGHGTASPDYAVEKCSYEPPKEMDGRANLLILWRISDIIL